MTTTSMRVQSGSFSRSLRNLSDTVDWRQRLERVWVALYGFMGGKNVSGNSFRLTAPPFSVLGAARLPHALASFVGSAEELLLPEASEEKVERAEELAKQVDGAMCTAIWFELTCLIELIEAALGEMTQVEDVVKNREGLSTFVVEVLRLAKNLGDLSEDVPGWNRNSKAVISNLRAILCSLEKPRGRLDAALRSASRARTQLSMIGAIRIVGHRGRRRRRPTARQHQLSSRRQVA